MTNSRSPSPAPGGGWSSPGLNINSGRSSPATAFPGITNGQQDLWGSSRSKNMGDRGYPAFETQNQGFFQRHMRRISNSLPRFNTSTHYAEKEKLQRGRWSAAQPTSLLGRLRSMTGRLGRKSKLRMLLVFLLLSSIWLFYHSRTSRNPDVATRLLTCCSTGILLAKNTLAWRWAEIRNIARSQRRRRRHGMERRERVGD